MVFDQIRKIMPEYQEDFYEVLKDSLKEKDV